MVLGLGLGVVADALKEQGWLGFEGWGLRLKQCDCRVRGKEQEMQSNKHGLVFSYFISSIAVSYFKRYGSFVLVGKALLTTQIQ